MEIRSGSTDKRYLSDIFDISQEYQNDIQAGKEKINFNTTHIVSCSNGSTKVGKGNGKAIYSLFDDEEIINALLTHANELKQTVKNKEPNKSDIDGWTMAEWETALYDMKKRKYTCDSVQFNATTGRINCMKFSEY